jgi:hypothetical protein
MEKYHVKIGNKLNRIFNFLNIYTEGDVMLWLLGNYAFDISEVEIRGAEITKIF